MPLLRPVLAIYSGGSECQGLGTFIDLLCHMFRFRFGLSLVVFFCEAFAVTST